MVSPQTIVPRQTRDGRRSVVMTSERSKQKEGMTVGDAANSRVTGAEGPDYYVLRSTLLIYPRPGRQRLVNLSNICVSLAGRLKSLLNGTLQPREIISECSRLTFRYGATQLKGAMS